MNESVKDLILNDLYLCKTTRKILFYFLAIAAKQYQKGFKHINVKQKKIADTVKKSKSFISKCLTQLESLNYIRSEKIGHRKIYFLDWKGISEKRNLQLTFKETSSELHGTLETLQEPEEEVLPSQPIYNNTNNHIRTTTQTALPPVVVSSKIIPETLLKSLQRKGYSVDFLKKCLSYIESELKKPERQIHNIRGYFINLIRQAHAGTWDFTSTDSQFERDRVKRDQAEKQAVKLKEEREQARRQADTRDQAVKIFEAMTLQERERLEHTVRTENHHLEPGILDRLVKVLMIAMIEDRSVKKS